MTHEMRLDPIPFAAIARGEKTVEMRLYDEKRRAITVGDSILFRERGGSGFLVATVVDLHLFPTFRELYATIPKTYLGYRADEEASPEDMELYYSLADQKSYGVVGIEISL